MTILHHDQPALPLGPTLDEADKVARMACCCKLSELLPIVRQQLQTRREQLAAQQRPAEAA
ncbi:hypothetical protein [Hymenobacter sp. CRA2]|uniref:hypothetical protein n=1 Tax=Hymenobacter sp. CRA2 TaxID=1955620 RepID=UPI00098F2C28|nr:hypothetical protein [Hymenobacter sp. CRA2]OON67447.1 hypothetical protein B0919_18465 [Hymenobacter sp. CRA2]